MNSLAPHALLYLGLAGSTFTAAPATAQDVASPADVSQAEFKRGNDAFREGQYETARSYYQAALRARRSFEIVCNLGRTEAQLGDDALALNHLDECLKEYPPGEDVAPMRARFFKLREQVRERCRVKDCTLPSTATEAGASHESNEAASSLEKAPARPHAETPQQGPPQQGTSWRIPFSLGLAVGGATGVALGAAFHVDSSSKTDVAQQRVERIQRRDGYCSGEAGDIECDELEDEISAARNAHTASVVSFAVGGGLLGAAVITYLFWPDNAEEQGTGSRALYGSVRAVQVRPEFTFSLDGSSGSVGLSGHF